MDCQQNPPRRSRNHCRMACIVPTRRGNFFARFSERGLLSLSFPDTLRGETKIVPLPSDPARDNMQIWKRRLALWLEHYLRGSEGPELPVPADTEGFSAFRLRTTICLRGIGRGETISYAELALRAAGDRRFARAAAGVCRTNPFPLLVPCHRVVATGGDLGGFAAGAEWKRFLLALEDAGGGGEKKT